MQSCIPPALSNEPDQLGICGGPGLFWISRLKQRVPTAVVLGLLAASFAGSVPSAAASPTSSPVAQTSSVAAACPAPTPGTAQCQALVRTDVTAASAAAVSPQSGPGGGYGPADLRSAYSLPTGTEGTGMTIAIVDAYDLPSAEADLATYRTWYGLPACTTANGCFHKVNENGGSTPPSTTAVGTGWDYEISLDLDMVSATCPNCHIVLVEANSNLYNDLGTGVNTAVTMGAMAVSNSYAGPEGSAFNETYLDSTYFNHPGHAIVASTGDCGYDCVGQFHGSVLNSVGYPAASPDVVAVGGTSLSGSVGSGWTETAWGNGYGGAGSGCSINEARPSWQPAGACGSMRSEADVSAVADPATGVAIVLNGLWGIEGGTSAAAPIIAGIYGLGGTPTAGSYPASHLYSDTADLNDAVGGNNDVTYHTCPSGSLLCNGKVGYDGPTGLGTPSGILAFSNATVPGKPIALTAHKGDSSASLSWTAPSSGGLPITGYTVTQVGSGVVTCAMAGATSCTVGGLTNGNNYTFTVHATNLVGDGPESDPSNTVTPATPTAPAKPTGVTALGGVQSAAVTWTAPDDGGSAITGYTVTSSPDGKQCTTTGALSCSVADLTIGQTYTFTVIAHNILGPSDPSDPSTGVLVISGATYHPLAAPARLLDTRSSIGLGGKLVANTPRTFQVTTRGGVPAGATAGTGNVTVTGETNSWAIYIGPTAIVKPPTSTINFSKGDVTANGLTVALSPGGTLSATYLSGSGNTTDLVFDVTGYFTPDTTGATYHPLTPARILDTRKNIGMAGKLIANTPRTFPVRLHGGVPADATAVTGNVTVTGSTNSWAVYLGPTAVVKPATSTINFKKGQVLANNLTVALSTSGALSATYLSSAGNTTDLVFDVTGYYTADLTGAKYVPITPARLLDTRIGNGLPGKLVANVPQTFNIAGRGVPSDATSVSANVTVVKETNSWAVFVGPIAAAKPETSTLNFSKGDVRANGLTVSLGAGGTLSVTYLSSAGNTTDLVLDVTGYYLP